MDRGTGSDALIDLGREAIATMAARVAEGATVTHCQLLASVFYEQLKERREDTPEGDEATCALLDAMLERCRGAADRRIPQAMLVDLRAVLATLQSPDRRPRLRVIPGGLAA